MPVVARPCVYAIKTPKTTTIFTPIPLPISENVTLGCCLAGPVVDNVHFAMIAGVSLGTFRAHVTARVRVVRPARRAEVVCAFLQRASASPAVVGRAPDRVSVITDGAFVALGAGRVVLAHLYRTEKCIFYLIVATLRTFSPPPPAETFHTSPCPLTFNWFAAAVIRNQRLEIDILREVERFYRKHHDLVVGKSEPVYVT